MPRRAPVKTVRYIYGRTIHLMGLTGPRGGEKTLCGKYLHSLMGTYNWYDPRCVLKEKRELAILKDRWMCPKCFARINKNV